jgi:hypothetical protein
LDLSLSTAVFGQEDLSDIIKITDLAEQVRDVVLETPGGHPNPDGHFKLTTEETDLLWSMAQEDLALQELNQKIAMNKKQGCLPGTSEVSSTIVEDEKKSNFKIMMTVRYFDNSQLDKAKGFFGMDKYSSWSLNQLNTNGNSGFNGITNLTSLKIKFKLKNPTINLDSLSVTEQEQYLKAFVKDSSGLDIPTNMLLKELTVEHLIKNPNNWKQTLGSIKNNLNFDDKMQIVTKLGGDFSDEYNYDRANGVGADASGIVTIEELLNSVKTNTPGGICRDVASAQALMLKEMGVSNAYIISYKTAAGRHANLIAQNPDDPDNIVKVNYGYRTETNGVGGNAVLAQDTNMPDFGLEYKIYSAEGKAITSIPSDLGKMLRSSTGGSNSNPIDVAQYSLNKIRVQTPYGAGNLFSGTTSQGDTVVGFAIDKRWESQNDIFNVEMGVSAFSLEGQRSLVTVDQKGFYGRVRTELNTPYLSLGDKFKMRAESSTDLALAISNNTVVGSGFTKKGEKQITEQMNLSFGATGIYQDKGTQIKGTIKTSLFPAFNNEVAADKIILAPSEILLRTEIRQSFSNDMTFLADSGLILRGFKGEAGIGDSYFLRTGLDNKKTGTSATIGISGPIQKNQARFLAGSTTRINAGINQNVGRMQFNMSYERDIELDQNLILLGIGVKF